MPYPLKAQATSNFRHNQRRVKLNQLKPVFHQRAGHRRYTLQQRQQYRAHARRRGGLRKLQISSHGNRRCCFAALHNGLRADRLRFASLPHLQVAGAQGRRRRARLGGLLDRAGAAHLCAHASGLHAVLAARLLPAQAGLHGGALAPQHAPRGVDLRQDRRATAGLLRGRHRQCVARGVDAGLRHQPAPGSGSQGQRAAHLRQGLRHDQPGDAQAAEQGAAAAAAAAHVWRGRWCRRCCVVCWQHQHGCWWHGWCEE